ncbi:hypothetical protein OSB04_013798, partial [Centaurea solstitialis]
WLPHLLIVLFLFTHFSIQRNPSIIFFIIFIFIFLLLHQFTDPLSIDLVLFHSPPNPPISSGNFSDDDPFGFYPWELLVEIMVSFCISIRMHLTCPNMLAGIEWEQQETITLFTAEGLVQIGGLMVPKRVSSAQKKQAKVKSSPKSQQFKESNYMDPAQGLCLGALFDIAATNVNLSHSIWADMSRRLCIIGFCRSIEMLSDVVEDTVLEHGGEVPTYIPMNVFRLSLIGLGTFGTMDKTKQTRTRDTVPCLVGLLHGTDRNKMELTCSAPTPWNNWNKIVVAEKASKGGLNERLTMTVAVPLLWGVPPASESLQIAVRSGGGIVDKVFWQWNFW